MKVSRVPGSQRYNPRIHPCNSPTRILEGLGMGGLQLFEKKNFLEPGPSKKVKVKGLGFRQERL